jgi:hypothetical protein
MVGFPLDSESAPSVDGNVSPSIEALESNYYALKRPGRALTSEMMQPGM